MCRCRVLSYWCQYPYFLGPINKGLWGLWHVQTYEMAGMQWQGWYSSSSTIVSTKLGGLIWRFKCYEACCGRGHKLQWNCPKCCEKCLMCGDFWRDLFAFDYLPIANQLASLCQSRTQWHEVNQLPKLWCKRGKWLGVPAQIPPTKISKF